MTTKRVTFYADETSLAYLDRMQNETGACASEIIRRALRKMDQPAPIEKRVHQPAVLIPHTQEAR